ILGQIGRRYRACSWSRRSGLLFFNLLFEGGDPLLERVRGFRVLLFELLQLLLQIGGCLRARDREGAEEARSQVPPRCHWLTSVYNATTDRGRATYVAPGIGSAACHATMSCGASRPVSIHLRHAPLLPGSSNSSCSQYAFRMMW